MKYISFVLAILFCSSVFAGDASLLKKSNFEDGAFCCPLQGKIERKCRAESSLSSLVDGRQGIETVCDLKVIPKADPQEAKPARLVQTLKRKGDLARDEIIGKNKRSRAPGLEFNDFASTKKSAINTKFVDLCAKNFPKNEKTFLILDGVEQRTAKEIRSRFGNKPTIYSPQIIEKEFDQMDQKIATVFLGSLDHFIDTADGPRANCLYLDFMGSPEGNEEKDLYPLGDIYYFLLKAKEIHNRVVLAFTLSQRVMNIPEGFKSAMEATMYQVRSIADYCDYDLEFREMISYKRNKNSTTMVTYLAQLTRKPGEQDPHLRQPFLTSNHMTYKIGGKPDQVRYWGFSPSYEESWVDLKDVGNYKVDALVKSPNAIEPLTKSHGLKGNKDKIQSYFQR